MPRLVRPPEANILPRVPRMRRAACGGGALACLAVALACLAVALACGPALAAAPVVAVPATVPDNPAIDAAGYLDVVVAAAEHRAARRVTEDAFIALAREPGTVILDARSRDKYDELHVRGAISLPFPDLTAQRLAELVPDPATPILIYCNNNFANAQGPFPAKLPAAALNLATYVALYTYGYRNVLELAPLVDVAATRIEFAGTLATTVR